MVVEPEASAADPVVVEAVESTPVPTPTRTPVPTPTALPTPTPLPPPLVPTEVLQRTVDEGFAALDELGVDYSFLIQVDEVGVVADRNGSQQLLPASNQKIVTAAAALELFPDEFRFVTEVRVDAEGNVSILAGGDPLLEQRHILAMAEAVIDELVDAAAGVGGPADDPGDNGEGAAADGEQQSRVAIGDLVVDVSHFPSTRSGPGWPQRYIPADVGPMSALVIDNNQHRGDDAYLADPDIGNAELIAELFDDAGIDITGAVRVGAGDTTAPLVARQTSPPLPGLIDILLGRSDNEIADALVRQIGLEFAGEGEIPAGQAVVFETIASLGVDLGPPVGDGSGLSRDNRLSAAQLVGVLDAARAQPWWPTMLDGLSSAGFDGSVAARLESDTTLGNVRAKTGTLDDVRALSGILETADGASVLFSFLVNGEQADEAAEALDQIVIAYASATLGQLTGDT